MDRRQRGSVLARRSVRLLRDHPRLVAFPVLSVLTATVVVGACYVAFFTNVEAIGRLYVDLGGPVASARQALAFGAFLVLFAAGAVVVTWWNAALAYCTRQAIRGGQVSVLDGLRAALAATPALVVHGLAVAVLGTLVAYAERNFEVPARFVTWLLGATYATLSVFVVPVAVFEGTSVRGTYARSAALVAERFGDAVTVSFGVLQVVAAVFAVPFLLTQVLLIAAMVTRSDALLRLVGLVVEDHVLLVGGSVVSLLGVGVVVGSAFATVAKVAVYVEVVDDEAVPLLSGIELPDVDGEPA